MNITPKYERGAKLYWLDEVWKQNWVPCGACDGKGQVRLLDGKVYSCPKCALPYLSEGTRNEVNPGQLQAKTSKYVEIREAHIDRITVEVREPYYQEPKGQDVVDIKYYVKSEHGRSNTYSEAQIPKEFILTSAEAQAAKARHELELVRVG